MRQVFIYDCEVITEAASVVIVCSVGDAISAIEPVRKRLGDVFDRLAAARLARVVFSDLRTPVYVKAGDELVALHPATITRTRCDDGMELREVSTDAGKSWTVDRRRFVGTQPQQHRVPASEEL
jgi:hypothetical protein